jgi:hypothetical protein
VNQSLNNNYPVTLTPEMKGAHTTGLDLIKLNNTTKFSHTILFLKIGSLYKLMQNKYGV